MNAFGGPCEYSPLTNRGVELAEACFREAGNTDRGPHDPGQIGPCTRGWNSQGWSISHDTSVGTEAK